MARVECECPECGEEFGVAENLIGQKVKCPGCQESFRVGASKRPPAPLIRPGKYIRVARETVWLLVIILALIVLFNRDPKDPFATLFAVMGICIVGYGIDRMLGT